MDHSLSSELSECPRSQSYRDKDKRSKYEKRQATNPERPEQKCDEESKSCEGPVLMLRRLGRKPKVSEAHRVRVRRK